MEKYGGNEHLGATPLRDTMVVENERFVEYDESGAIKGAPKKATKSKYPEDIMVNNHTSVWGSWWYEFKWGYACCYSTVKNSYCTGEDGKAAFQQEGNMLLLPEADGEADGDALESSNGTRESEREEVQESTANNSKKRTLEEIKSGITEEELESYKRSRLAAEDPMAKFIGKDID
jgi:pre-mRNA-processing factor SLU7